ncbi:FLAD1 [Cordylochernes scorpioides]|uniref:FLAD1 n=1 Tax=Cordylochernes scorpioides TaxID=51811 RepID=A0ABY6L9U8_9ARAC|nr:FLAD1 [Cordylochernes scorpioides]
MEERPSAAIVIIGDEILKGQTYDTNSHFLCKNLYQLGVKVSRIVVIPDQVDSIAEEVAYCSKNFEFVLTSGGIGPTHDDVTYLGVAQAFGEKLVKNVELANMVYDLFNSDNIKMEVIEKTCMLPESSQLHYPAQPASKEEVFPIVSVFNVYIFPGIPTYLEFAFQFLKDIFCQSNARKFHTRALYIDIDEIKISEQLRKAAEKFETKVQIGSYPKILNELYRVQIILEGDTEDALEEVEIYLRQNLPSNKIVNPCDAFSIENIDYLYTFKIFGESDDPVKKTIVILEDCLNRFELENLCISFNGGKDCTLLLHIACLVFYKHKGESFHSFKALYIRPKDPFPEVEDFITNCVERRSMDELDTTQITPSDTKDSQINWLSNKITTAMSQAGMLRTSKLGDERSKPWFDGECYLAKRR